jgi:hypothetical protein
MKTRWLLAIASAMVLLVHGFAKGQFMAKIPARGRPARSRRC